MSERILRENFVALAQAYADGKKWSLRTTSKEIHGGTNFIERYLNGEVSPTIKTYYRMMRKMRDTWPTGHPRPELHHRIPVWGD